MSVVYLSSRLKLCLFPSMFLLTLCCYLGFNLCFLLLISFFSIFEYAQQVLALDVELAWFYYGFKEVGTYGLDNLARFVDDGDGLHVCILNVYCSR